MEDQKHTPYFHLSKNEYGKMWLMYRPDDEGRYRLWEPITAEFWNEFEKLLRATELLQQVAELTKENDEYRKNGDMVRATIELEYTEKIKALTEQVEKLKQDKSNLIAGIQRGDELHAMLKWDQELSPYQKALQELSRLREREKELVEALRELYNGTITMKLKNQIESLLSKFEATEPKQ